MLRLGVAQHLLSGKYCQHLEGLDYIWGRWRLHPEWLILDLDDGRYEVDLERCLISAQTLDWICQVAGKTWADDETLAGLVRAIDHILHPQGTLCSFGTSRTITRPDVKHLVATYVNRHRDHGCADLWKLEGAL